MTTEKAIEQLEDLIKEAESHMTGNKIDDEIPIDDKTALEIGIQALENNISAAKGIWTAENSRPKSFVFVCSLCKGKAYDKPYGSAKRTTRKACKLAYCPNCGAKMEV